MAERKGFYYSARPLVKNFFRALGYFAGRGAGSAGRTQRQSEVGEASGNTRVPREGHEEGSRGLRERQFAQPPVSNPINARALKGREGAMLISLAPLQGADL